ncbi:MAG: hypothetical protein CBD76_02515 [Pelagibacteraceae bacterium TMED216]|nr:MAG: hypothetical protein CBD76_02515 [Pelagibacteraceae bacterium TMED216]
MKDTKAIIISICGPFLSQPEIKLIKREKPWGIILFKRNIKSSEQLKKLTSKIKFVAKNKNFPILIDQEGGSVSRLSKILFDKGFSQKFFGDINEINNEISLKIYKKYMVYIIKKLKSLGLNINTVPVADLLTNFTNKILNNRCYSKKKKIIQKLCIFCIRTYRENKIGTVIKHIPGHGKAKVDSHLDLPVVKFSKNILFNNDFKCFKNQKSHFAMTAHVLYKDIDKNNCATHSQKIIKLIRTKIGFKGLLISDDISMRALKYDIITNAHKALKAGCNLILYCKGNTLECSKLIKTIPIIDNYTQKKTSEFFNFLS